MSLVHRILHHIRRLQKYIDKPWYPFVLMGLTFADLFIVIVPSDGIVVASAAARPKKWFLIGASLALGSLVGSICLALITKHFGEPFIHWMSPSLLGSETWIKAELWFSDWSVWAVFASAASPLAQQPIIFIAAIADMPLHWLALAVGCGRLLKFLSYAWIASHSPKLLKKIPALDDELKALEETSSKKN